jgi:uncharacterized protein
VADHWQTLLAAELPGARTVAPLERDKLSLAARVAAIQAALEGIDGPVILVAHSGGVPMIVHWAQKHRRAIKGALLATPADIETPLPSGYPTMDDLRSHGWLPLPRARLPFPSLVAASGDDPMAKPARVAQLARDWGSRLVEIGNAGHLNPASGYGPWPLAIELIAALDL